jgi:hypothetical protein
MVDKTNSIKEILKNTKDLLSQDQELAKEGKDFHDKVAKATEGNILILNKIYENKSVEEIDKRSKKVIEIVNHQIQDVLTLDKEVFTTEDPLLLNREISEDSLLLDNDIEEENQSPPEKNIEIASQDDPIYNQGFSLSSPSTTEINSSEGTEPESLNGLLVSRIKKLEDQQERMLNQLNKLVDELKSLNPSEEISLKFDILSNQVSNEMDEKIESIKGDIASIDQSKDELAKDLEAQKNTMELGFSNLEKTNEEFKDQLNNLDFKIDDFTNSLENKIGDQMNAQDTKLESFQVEQNEKLERQEASVKKKLDDNVSSFKNLIEDDQLLRKKEEEENKKNSPEHQANIRLNSIYKLLEMQVTQSLIHTNSKNINTTNPVNSSPNLDNLYLKAMTDLNQKLDPLSNLNQTLLELSKSIQNTKNESSDDDSNSFENKKLNEILQKLNNLSVQEGKFEEVAQLIKNMKEESNSKNLEKLSLDLKEIKQFKDLHLAKNFLEKLILSETQIWIDSNQIQIEEISKKLLHK